MKKNICFAKVLVLLTGWIFMSTPALWAQNSGSAGLSNQYELNTNLDLSIQANILGTLGMTQMQDLNFGSISATTPGYVRIDPRGLDNFNTGLDGYPGLLQITGNASGSEPETMVQIQYQGSTLLTSGDNTMVCSIEVRGGQSINQMVSTVYSTAGQNKVINVSLDATNGEHYLFIGGYLSPAGTDPTAPVPLNNQPGGIYTGTLNIKVNYL